MKKYLLALLPVLILGCNKEIVRENPADTLTASTLTNTSSPESSTNSKDRSSISTTYKLYTIRQGAHYCDQSAFKSVSGSAMNFTVKFDNSAIYTLPKTDYDHNLDVNKLYGFSEGFDNQYNSARIGWRWYNNELQLLAYVYVNGKVLRDPVTFDVPLIKAVALNTDITCSIVLSGYQYKFTVDGVTITTARGINASKYYGFQQYLYFGGSYTAPI